MTEAQAAGGDAVARAFGEDGFQVEPNSRYVVTMQMTLSSSGVATARTYFRLGNKVGDGTSTWGPDAPGITTSVADVAYKSFAIETGGNSRLSLAFRLDAGAEVNAYFGSITIRKAASAELIVDGAITATKIAANAIAVGTAAIQDGAIVNAMIGNLSADKITAGVLAAARIAAGSIDAGKLAASAVTADKLAANSVTVDKIAVNAVTADKITTNAVTTAKIAAGAVTATEIATNAVTAAKINVTSLSAIAANLGTVTAGRIQNAANTAFWNLGASGSTRMLQLGNDMTYDEVNGLQINKLNVIGSLQLAGNAVTQVTSVNVGSLVMFVSETRAVSSTEIDSNYATYVYIEGESHIREVAGTMVDESFFSENVVSVPAAAAGWAYVTATLGGLQYRSIGSLQLPEAFQGGSFGSPRWAPRKFTSNVVAIPLGATNVTIRFSPLSREYPSGDPRAVHGIRVHVLQLKR